MTIILLLPLSRFKVSDFTKKKVIFSICKLLIDNGLNELKQQLDCFYPANSNLQRIITKKLGCNKYIHDSRFNEKLI
jgi:hypothetical protein